MSSVIDADTRRYAAALGRRHFDGTVTLEVLLDSFVESKDPLIRALLEAAVHQPSRGFAGISQEQWERTFWRPVSGILEELEKGADGVAPSERVYPRVGILGICGSGAITILAGASATEHALRYLGRLSGGHSLGPWWRHVELLGASIMGAATLAGILATVRRYRLYRTRHNPYGESNDDVG